MRVRHRTFDVSTSHEFLSRDVPAISGGDFAFFRIRNVVLRPRSSSPSHPSLSTHVIRPYGAALATRLIIANHVRIVASVAGERGGRGIGFVPRIANEARRPPGRVCQYSDEYANIPAADNEAMRTQDRFRPRGLTYDVPPVCSLHRDGYVMSMNAHIFSICINNK